MYPHIIREIRMTDRFLVQHVRTKETATEFSVTIGTSPDDRQLLMQTMYDHMWHMALRLLADREVDEADDEGNTLLHVAAGVGVVDAVTVAVKSGASLTARNNTGHTPPELTYVATLLISLGADVNARNKNGVKPLVLTSTQKTASDTLLFTTPA
nr:hypothetical protein BaRGS_027462 [Batillaria attramentaria]